MNKRDIEKFKKRLLEEKIGLEGELSNIGRKNPGSAGGWEATAGEMVVNTADENEVADKLEELEENTVIVNQLEKQLAEVNSALERIENGTYGIDENTGDPIELDRLEANPSAKHSIKNP